MDCGVSKKASEHFLPLKWCDDGYTARCKPCSRIAKVSRKPLAHTPKTLGEYEIAYEVLRDKLKVLSALPYQPIPESPPQKVVYSFGFIEEKTGRNRWWNAGEIIAHQYEIHMLKQRGCQLVDVLPGELEQRRLAAGLPPLFEKRS